MGDIGPTRQVFEVLPADEHVRPGAPVGDAAPDRVDAAEAADAPADAVPAE